MPPQCCGSIESEKYFFNANLIGSILRDDKLFCTVKKNVSFYWYLTQIVSRFPN